MSRRRWRERSWACQIYATARPYESLVVLVPGSFAGGIAMAIASFVLYKLWKPPSEVELTWFVKQLIFGAFYAPTYVLFTVSLMLLAVQDYVGRLNQLVPPPIFAHTERLLRVTLDTAIQSLSILEGREAGGTLAQRDQEISYDILEIVRVPGNGGIRVLLRISRQPVSQPGYDPGADAQRVPNLWRIEADRWGRVQSVTPGMTGAGQMYG